MSQRYPYIGSFCFYDSSYENSGYGHLTVQISPTDSITIKLDATSIDAVRRIADDLLSRHRQEMSKTVSTITVLPAITYADKEEALDVDTF